MTTTRAQRAAMRENELLRARLPTLAELLDRDATHERARAALGAWLAAVSGLYDTHEVRTLEGFAALETWLLEGRDEQ